MFGFISGWHTVLNVADEIVETSPENSLIFLNTTSEAPEAMIAVFLCKTYILPKICG